MKKRKLGESSLEVSAIELSPKNPRELETAASKIAVQGARYPEELQKMVGR